MMNFYKGKLTYTVAVAGFIWGVYLLIIGEITQGTATIMAALGLFGIRRAI